MPTPDHIRAHRHCIFHKEELQASERCGCFDCLTTFPPSEIKKWTDKGQTAICPRCGIDSVIGSESGYPITGHFLGKMQRHWFAALDVNDLSVDTPFLPA